MKGGRRGEVKWKEMPKLERPAAAAASTLEEEEGKGRGGEERRAPLTGKKSPMGLVMVMLVGGVGKWPCPAAVQSIGFRKKCKFVE
jgi:hypothetical protein